MILAYVSSFVGNPVAKKKLAYSRLFGVDLFKIYNFTRLKMVVQTFLILSWAMGGCKFVVIYSPGNIYTAYQIYFKLSF